MSSYLDEDILEEKLKNCFFRCLHREASGAGDAFMQQYRGLLQRLEDVFLKVDKIQGITTKDEQYIDKMYDFLQGAMKTPDPNLGIGDKIYKNIEQAKEQSIISDRMYGVLKGSAFPFLKQLMDIGNESYNTQKQKDPNAVLHMSPTPTIK